MEKRCAEVRGNQTFFRPVGTVGNDWVTETKNKIGKGKGQVAL